MRISDWSSDVCSSDLPADENLVAAIADQRVRKAGPDETLDAVEPVALGVTAITRAGLEVDRDGTRVGAVVDRIDAAPSDQHIGARTALKQIVAAAPFEPVRARAAIQRLVGTDPGQRIVEGRAAHRLDTRQPVTRRIAGAGLHPQVQLALHRRPP